MNEEDLLQYFGNLNVKNTYHEVKKSPLLSTKVR